MQVLRGDRAYAWRLDHKWLVEYAWQWAFLKRLKERLVDQSRSGTTPAMRAGYSTPTVQYVPDQNRRFEQATATHSAGSVAPTAPELHTQLVPSAHA